MRLSGTKTGAINQYRGLGNQLWDLAGNRPSLDLPFSETKSLIDTTTGTNLIDFSRASSGTYVGSDGLIKTATTNYFLNSETFATTWNRFGILAFGSGSTEDAIAAPNGSITADFLGEDTSTGRHRISLGISFIAGVTYTLSLFAKSSNRNIYINADVAFGGSAGFNLQAGTVTANTGSASIENAGNGWYRCSVSATASSTSTASVYLQIQTGIVDENYTGDGTSGIYIWGAQLEQSSTVGEYIPTTSTINSAPRFDHDPTTGESLGLLVEESRTNYVLGSESFAGWTVASNGLTQSTASAIAAPNGQSGAVQLFTEDLTTGVHRIFIAPSTGQLTHAHSVFVKAAAGTRVIYLSSDDPTGTRQDIAFDLQTGSFVSSTGDWSNPFITPYPNGWYRIGGTITDSGGNTLFIIGLNAGASSYPGDGTSGIYIWGAQLEAGSFPTSYIPTEGTTVTRADDVASISGSNFSSWYNASEGTVFVSWNKSWGGNWPYFRGIFRVYNTTSPWDDFISYGSTNGANNQIYWAAETANVGQLSYVQYPASGPNRFSHAIGIANNDAAMARSGQVIGSDTTVSLPSVNEAFFDSTNIHLSRLTYWPTRLPNETLQTITN